MKKLLFMVMTLVPAAFAVDGVVLINQSTVMAAGGFPYVISTSGSYKLSGNLQVTVGFDGIQITASNVTLDLNGFSITSAVTDTNILVRSVGAVKGVTVRNGVISSQGDVLINLASAGGGTVVEDLTLLQLNGGGQVLLGSSIVRRVSFPGGGLNVTCPALVVDSAAGLFHSITISSTACTYGFVSGPVI